MPNENVIDDRQNLPSDSSQDLSGQKTFDGQNSPSALFEFSQDESMFMGAGGFPDETPPDPFLEQNEYYEQWNNVGGMPVDPTYPDRDGEWFVSGFSDRFGRKTSTPYEEIRQRKEEQDRKDQERFLAQQRKITESGQLPKSMQDRKPYLGRNRLIAKGNANYQRILADVLKWTKMPRVKDDDEIAERLDFFFTACAENNELPTVEKMGLALGVSSSTLRDWESGKRGATRAEMIRMAKYVLAAMDAQLAMEGKIDRVMYIFRSKNFYGMKDQVDIAQASVEQVSNRTVEEIAERYDSVIDITPDADRKR